MNKMTREEWESKSDEWRRGWRYGQGDTSIEEEDADEFRDGYLYALLNPFGSCYSVDATTGTK